MCVSRYVMLLLTAVLMISALGAKSAQAQDVTDEQVQAWIKKTVASLYAQQAGGNWGGAGKNSITGINAIVLYALFAAGEDIQMNDKLKSAVEWMIETDSFGTYDVGLRCHVWAKLPPRYLEMLEKDALLLHDDLSPDGKANYTCDGDQQWGDNSTTQYNTLGVWEAAKRGIEFSGDYWERVEKGFLRDQLPDGQWGYKNNTKIRASMTAAGLTCLFITNDFLHTHEYKEPGVGEKHPVYQAIQKGIGWWDKNFMGEVYTPYTWVGIERVGVASGYKYFNNKDWYRAGAAAIIKGNVRSAHSKGPSNLCFELIFMAAGRKPVMINKLKVPGMRWDNRPRDVAKLTAWTSDESEKQMLWQLIEITRSPQDFMDAQIMYLASDQAINFDAAAKAKVKQYIDAGGLFFTTSDAGSSAFDASVEALAQELYPTYKWEKIPADHYIYKLVYKTDATQTPLFGIHNGVRYLFVHSGRDIAWSLHSGAISKEINDWQTMANIFHYATERGKVRPKLAQHFPVLKGGSGTSRTVARVVYDGNWNPEPAGWEAGGIFMKNKGKVSPSLKEVDLSSLGAETERFAHLAGSGKANFTDEQVAQMEAFVKNGGTLLVESAGGDTEFFMSMRQKLGAIGEVIPLDPGHELYKGASFGGFDATHVGYRPYRSYRTKTPQRVPSLMAVMIDGRPAVILSGDDLSNGMLDQPVWGVFGYNHESACMLMANMLLWANK